MQVLGGETGRPLSSPSRISTSRALGVPCPAPALLCAAHEKCRPPENYQQKLPKCCGLPPGPAPSKSAAALRLGPSRRGWGGKLGSLVNVSRKPDMAATGDYPRGFTSALVGQLPGCPAARLLSCLAAWLPGCLAAWLPGCLAAWLPGCLAAWLPSCLAAWPTGCLAAWLPGKLPP